MRNKNENYFAVLLAGGVGSRFWPVSTSGYPKQFHDMMGTGQTLLQRTYSRLAKIVPVENILVLTNSAYWNLVLEQLPGISSGNIILEPAMRNTAPCILLAALKIKKWNPNAVMLVAPSDHWIEDEKAFAGDVRSGFNAAKDGRSLITLGVKPTFPSTGYGYIKWEDSGRENHGLYKVQRFTEKPGIEEAVKFLQDGNYLWNAGIFIWGVSSIVNAFSSHCSGLYRLFEDGSDKLNEPEEKEFIEVVYPKAQDISIDYAILEKSDHVYVIPASFDWDDLGTWGALYNKSEKDNEGNAVVNASFIGLGAGKNMIHTHRSKIVVVGGLQNFIIVDDEDVLLIVPKEKEQDIKKIRAEVMERFGNSLG